MVIIQSYLFVLLLASLSASYTSDCPTSEPCGPPAYDKCAKLYSILERALLENPGNLYQLHDSFFPSSNSEPVYAIVTFKLNGGCYFTCWTSSVLLKFVDPVVLTALQLQLLNTLLETVGASDLTAGYSSYGAKLSLELNFTTEFNHSDYNIVGEVLQGLTSWVSAQLYL